MTRASLDAPVTPPCHCSSVESQHPSWQGHPLRSTAPAFLALVSPVQHVGSSRVAQPQPLIPLKAREARPSFCGPEQGKRTRQGPGESRAGRRSGSFPAAGPLPPREGAVASGLACVGGVRQAGSPQRVESGTSAAQLLPKHTQAPFQGEWTPWGLACPACLGGGLCLCPPSPQHPQAEHFQGRRLLGRGHFRAANLATLPTKPVWIPGLEVPTSKEVREGHTQRPGARFCHSCVT